ncbi:ceramide phosphoethanolamine synthase-like [Babylonia areolata]|uniref:ceramide phosphoethanolamine synthase-like n=1 Tax=Babylonia areolata TaxID=304850 RepID=UPI003FD289B8
MPSLPVSQLFRDEMSFFKFVGLIVLGYFAVMDIILLVTFMRTDLVESSKGSSEDELYSPFTHLSVKALMNDHASQYITAPAVEYFDSFTRFSTVFYFITPNMISFFHLFLAFISARFVSSETLHTRRVGVVLFEIRTLLDALDGVVFRSHSHTKGVYQSVRSSLGYYVDITCDGIGGIFLMFGVLFYLFKRFDPTKQSDMSWKSAEAGATGKNGVNGLSGVGGIHVSYSKKMLFWKCWCYGIAIALGGKFWDNVVDGFKGLFQTPIQDPTMSALQFDTCHSATTIFIMFIWRLFEGQALLQYVLVAIFIDRIWEFLNFVQYLMFAIVTGLYLLSLLYIRHVQTLLHM